MVGAIEFMRAWHDECMQAKVCEECAINDKCYGMDIMRMDDKSINELIGMVMREKARRSKNEC